MRSGKPAVWFATTNLNKFREAHQVLADRGVRIRRLKMPKIEIQHEKLESIAVFAVNSLRSRRNGVMVVEDSGLFVSNLNGFPGPYSSYVFKTIGTTGILRLIQRNASRQAKFQSVVAALLPNGRCKIFKGVVEGSISDHAAGTSGFGFDPIFVPDGTESTFAQLSRDSKNRRSHRAQAFQRFARWYTNWDTPATSHKAEP